MLLSDRYTAGSGFVTFRQVHSWVRLCSCHRSSLHSGMVVAHLASSAVRICLGVVTYNVYSCRLLSKVTCIYVVTCNVYSVRLLSTVICTYVLLLGLMFIMHICFFHFCICICSAQLSVSYIEKRYRNKVIVKIITKIVTRLSWYTMVRLIN